MPSVINSSRKKELEAYFWDMFVVDAFIGNWDRHNGNWGFLYSQEKDELERKETELRYQKMLEDRR